MQTSTSLRPVKAAEFLGVSKSTLWSWAKSRPDFPKPQKIGPRTTVWDQSKLSAWRDAQGTSTSENPCTKKST